MSKQTDVLKQLKEANAERVEDFGHKLMDWTPTDWACAMAGETGELCNIVKKLHRGDYTLEELHENEMLADEAADIVCYLDLLCQRLGIDLQTAVVNKFNKVSKKIGSDVTIYYY